MGDREKAVIFDLDGTLCDISHRLHVICNEDGSRKDNPDWDLFNMMCISDKPIDKIIDILKFYKEHTDWKILIVTGRSMISNLATLKWLDVMGIQFDELIMRQTGNYNSDVVVKKEIYEVRIEMVYDVQLVFDDRDSVVNMWRELGLTCLQCRKGDY